MRDGEREREKRDVFNGEFVAAVERKNGKKRKSVSRSEDARVSSIDNE